MTTNRQTRSRGFTIIELSIALAFLGILLIAILTLTISAGKMYVKGVTNKTLNQTGRDIQDIIRNDFLSADASNVSTAVITEGSGALMTGRICLGNVSYLWNTAPIILSPTGFVIKQSGSTKPIRFARVVDPGGSLCVKSGSSYPRVLTTDPTKFTELIGGDSLGRDFAIYSFTLTKWGLSSERGLYELKYAIGTNESGTTQAVSGYNQCKPPSNQTADFDYCSVGSFDMIVRVGGGVN